MRGVWHGIRCVWPILADKCYLAAYSYKEDFLKKFKGHFGHLSIIEKPICGEEIFQQVALAVETNTVALLLTQASKYSIACQYKSLLFFELLHLFMEFVQHLVALNC